MEEGLLLRSLNKLSEALQKNNGGELKAIGREMGEHALVDGETAFVEIGVVAYSANKILDKKHLSSSSDWQHVRERASTRVQASLAALRNGRREEMFSSISSAVSELDHFSLSEGRFQTSLALKARVKIATDIYAHGASLGKACELTGAPKQEVLPYLGATKLSDKFVSLPLADRFSFAKTLFGEK